MFIEGESLEKYIFLPDQKLLIGINSSTAAEDLYPIIYPNLYLITILQLDIQVTNIINLSKESLHERRPQSSKTILGRSRS